MPTTAQPKNKGAKMNDFINEQIELFENGIKHATRQLETMKGVISNTNYIVQYGYAMTASTNENNYTILVHEKTPTQFTIKSALKIVKECVVKNHKGEKMTGEIITAFDYYTENLRRHEESLKDFKNIK